MKNVTLSQEIRILKMIMKSKDQKIIKQEKQIERIMITVSVAYDMTEDEKTKNVLKKLIG